MKRLYTVEVKATDIIYDIEAESDEQAEELAADMFYGNIGGAEVETEILYDSDTDSERE